MENNSNQGETFPASSSSRTKPQKTSPATICAIILSVIALIVGIVCTIQVNSVSSSLKNLKEDLGYTDSGNEDNSEDVSDIEDVPSCEFPSSASEVSYLDLISGNDQYFINQTTIDYYNAASTDDSDQLVTIDTSEIFEALVSSGTTDFGNYDENAENSTWTAQLYTTTDHYCVAGGSDSAPEWFANLTNLANSKLSSTVE